MRFHIKPISRFRKIGLSLQRLGIETGDLMVPHVNTHAMPLNFHDIPRNFDAINHFHDIPQFQIPYGIPGAIEIPLRSLMFIVPLEVIQGLHRGGQLGSSGL